MPSSSISRVPGVALAASLAAGGVGNRCSTCLSLGTCYLYLQSAQYNVPYAAHALCFGIMGNYSEHRAGYKSPKPSKGARKAMILHTVGVQANVMTMDISNTSISDTYAPEARTMVLQEGK